jgi:glycine/D-amino acid oxidase-like deaminating enzyme
MQTPRMPKSLWAATAPPAPDTPKLEGEARTDAVIVGGGFTGLSAALHLAETGAKVILLEAAEPGWGASGRNGGQVIAGFKYDPGELAAKFGPVAGVRLAEFADGTADLVFGLIERYKISCTAARTGWIQAAHCAKARRTLENRAGHWQRLGAPVEVLDAKAVAAATGTEIYSGAMLDRRGGVLQPLAYARGLAKAAQAVGAQIHGESPARRIVPDGKSWRVESSQGAVIANQVLLCTNAYTDALWPGLARSVIPAFSYQIATVPLGDNLRAGILPKGEGVSDTRRLLRYFRLDPQGRLILGGRGRFKETEEPAFYRGIANELRGLFPRLETVDLEFHWSGQVALTLDHMPHLHELAPGVTAALGYNGRGVAMATAVGKLLAERVQGRPLADLPLPASPLKPVPFHGLRQPALAAAVTWKRALDRIDSWR